MSTRIVKRAKCPVCQHYIAVLSDDRLAFHYPTPGVGVPCPPTKVGKEAAA